MRADKVFKVIYNSEEAILEIEFEAGTDSDLPSRLLIYNAVLHQEHQLPVITIVVYPFRVTIAKSPLQVSIGESSILTFHFEVLPLVQLDAEQFVRKNVVCMYPLLPTMQSRQSRDDQAGNGRADSVVSGG